MAVQLVAGGVSDRIGIVIEDSVAVTAMQAVIERTPDEDLFRLYRGRSFVEFALEKADIDGSPASVCRDHTPEDHARGGM